jgi:hypothetical protein
LGARRKGAADLQKYFRYRAVIGSLLNRDIGVSKMTNAIRSRTVRFSPKTGDGKVTKN